MQPDVSVIVPCYRATEYIAEALDSLRAQTLRNFETILINDGCPDTAAFERALEPYPGEIVYLRQENAGPSAARNAGIQASRAPLVALLDSDDAWEPNYLEAQTGILRGRPDIDVVYPNAIYFGAGAGSWSGRKFMSMLPGSSEPTFLGLISGQCTVFVGVTARREALLRVGLFDPALKFAEDLDLWLRLAKAGSKFLYNPQPLVRYRLRESSLSDDRVLLLRGGLIAYRKQLDSGLAEEERRALEKTIRTHEAAIDFRLGRKALYAGRREEALERFGRANRELRSNRLRAAILTLRVCPGLLHKFIHYRYPSEHLFLH
jgi:glycosyltransferase involved in cell wall biosynthesis